MRTCGWNDVHIVSTCLLLSAIYGRAVAIMVLKYKHVLLFDKINFEFTSVSHISFSNQH